MPCTNAQLPLLHLSLSLSLVVKYISLLYDIGSVVIPWNPPTVSLKVKDFDMRSQQRLVDVF